MKTIVEQDGSQKDIVKTAYDNNGYRYYALGLLTTVYVLNFVDRQILTILQEPIKEELNLSDSQLGLLTGFSFALFYVVMGFPIARWADRGVRRNIIGLAVGFWSVMTALCGMAQTYSYLLAARVGVGVGEAGCSPSAHSMISDVFPPSKRATALATYNVGINIGVLLGFLLGGWLQEIYGWRIAFFAVAAPGIVLALIVKYTLAAPLRGYSEISSYNAEVSEPANLKEVLFQLLTKPTFRHLCMACALVAFAGYGMTNWLPSFLIRSYGMATGPIGTWLALIVGVGGGLGTFFSGYFSDRLGSKDCRWYVWISLLGFGISLPLIFAMLFVDNAVLSLIFFIIPGALQSIYLAPLIAVTHSLVESRMRAQASAVVFLILNLIGLGLGPLLIGILSDILAPSFGTNSLRYSMMILISTALGWGLIHFMLAARTIKKDMSCDQ